MERLLGDAQLASDLGEFFGPLSARELNYLCEHEWAVSADDILWRRSKLGLHMSAEEQNALRTYMSERAGKKSNEAKKV